MDGGGRGGMSGCAGGGGGGEEGGGEVAEGIVRALYRGRVSAPWKSEVEKTGEATEGYQGD